MKRYRTGAMVTGVRANQTGIPSMLRKSIRFATRASARAQVVQAVKACGHKTHVGSCASCQRAQLAKWQAQLDATER